jgi:hypothetical protein
MVTTVPRYRAVRESDGSWSVVDVDTELAYCVRGFPMVLLREDIAHALAEVLNSVSAVTRTIH